MQTWEIKLELEHVTFSVFYLIEMLIWIGERYILPKIPPNSVQWFQGYEQLNDSQNNRKQ